MLFCLSFEMFDILKLKDMPNCVCFHHIIFTYKTIASLFKGSRAYNTYIVIKLCYVEIYKDTL